MVKEIRYYPVIFFRARCFAETVFHVIFGKHYVASWKDRLYKTEGCATNFARKQIVTEGLKDVYQLPGAKKISIKRVEFDPEELRSLPPRTKAILLKHKGRVLEALGDVG